MISKGELQFFDSIKDKCNIIFDVGCRTDIHYIELKSDAQFHLFEPNSIFFEEIKRKLSSCKSNLKINNFGLGNKTESLIYYENTQSFPKRVTHTLSDSGTAKYCYVKRFTEYLSENNIAMVDFLKIDTEGYEPEILYDNVEYLKTHVPYIQFEYASTWLDKSEVTSLHEVYKTFSDTFDFFYLYDEMHPICRDTEVAPVPITENLVGVIQSYMVNAYGFNIAMKRK